jgi:Malectin domain
MAFSNRQESDELERILASGILAKAPRQARLLRHICNEYLQGRADQIKEYTLATEALGRPADFDQNRDAIVRVEIHRLRKKLKEYYEGEGLTHDLQIVIDSGKYIPRFVVKEKALSGKSAETSEVAHPPQRQKKDHPPLPLPAPGKGKSPKQSRALLIGLGMLAFAAVGVVAFLTYGSHWRSRIQPSTPAELAPVAPPTGLSRSQDSIRILCGYSKDKYIDRGGNVWLGDRYYSGGETSAEPELFLARAPDMGLYQNFRFGDFSYRIPLKPGNYELHLYFVETHYGPGSLSGRGETSRLFDVLLDGKSLLRIFDIIKDAGGNNIADERVFKDVRPGPDGYLQLNFQRLVDSPLLNALAIEPATPGKINPIRILAQDNSYTDHAGNIWSPDRYYSGGQLAQHISTTPVSGTLDPQLYSSERFGNFTYAIPVPPGKYKVTLRFAETYWGRKNSHYNLPDQNGSPVGGVGSRVFDVFCNGTALLRNFDIFKEAGGPLVARDKTFHNLEPDSQGKLDLSFVPVMDYACVNAIEVEDESE